MTKKIPPTHPGDVLLEDIMKPLGLSANKVAMAMRVPLTRITEIISHERAVTADTALRLARCFGTTAQSAQSSSQARSCRRRRKEGG